ncbi:MAG: hypothetical protein GEV11_08555 [Streptosporangiales bacterium]|nr:hypothetical protein [Streptosporangiales bacterium]
MPFSSAVSGDRRDTAAADRATTATTPLRDLADRARIGVGTAVDMSALAADPPYRRAVAREFSTVTAENVMKWEALEPERGRLDFAAGRSAFAVAPAVGSASGSAFSASSWSCPTIPYPAPAMCAARLSPPSR